ncbi:MAG: MerR family transcriptional regulator [Clostridia bacterium]|nr:MerR family transcriptional regulator [Clostridia bacterium]
MKIKDVIAKTGLTDRAIRLYIENGLVAPENQKSYNGRNNYNFTQTDIESFEQIALLRKADFSLEQIKTLKSGGDSAKEVLIAYLTDKKESVVTGQKIVDALKDIPQQEIVTIDYVCEKIKASLENTPLPESDRKATKGELLEKWLMRIPAIIFLAVCGGLGLGVLLAYREKFPFPHFYGNPVNFIGTVYVFIPIISAITVLLLYRKHRFDFKERKKRRWIAGIALAVALLVAVLPIGIASLMLIPPVYSETNSPENYLIMGSYVKMYGDDIHKLFPANIPRSAIAEGSQWYPPDKFLDTTKYYYYFQDVVDPSFQLYAEWVLPKDEFVEELNRIYNFYPEGAKQQVQWGDWVCLSFTEDTLNVKQAKEEIDYYYLLFAYNEKTGGVRYIASYSMDCGREEDPYFLELQWE